MTWIRSLCTAFAMYSRLPVPCGSGAGSDRVHHTGPCDRRDSRGRIYGHQRRPELLGRQSQKTGNSLRPSYRRFFRDFTHDAGGFLDRSSGGDRGKRRCAVLGHIWIGVCFGESAERSCGLALSECAGRGHFVGLHRSACVGPPHQYDPADSSCGPFVRRNTGVASDLRLCGSRYVSGDLGTLQAQGLSGSRRHHRRSGRVVPMPVRSGCGVRTGCGVPVCSEIATQDYLWR